MGKSASLKSRKPLWKAPMKSSSARTSTGKISSPSSNFRPSCPSASRSLDHLRVTHMLAACKCSPTSPDLTSRIRGPRAAAMSCRTPLSRWLVTRVPSDRRGLKVWSLAVCWISIAVSSSRRMPLTALTTMQRLRCHVNPVHPMSCDVN